jgi:hypothetical protein
VSERTAAHVREALAWANQEARIQLQDGTPLSDWVTTPDAFDFAVAAALAVYPRSALQVRLEGPVN